MNNLSFEDLKLLVIGDLILDEYFSGSSLDTTIELTSPIIKVKEVKQIMGGAANVANNIKSMGGDVVLIGALGNDKHGDSLRELLIEKNIENIIFNSTSCTTFKARVHDSHTQIVRFDIEEKCKIEKDISQVQSIIEGVISEVDGIIISDYNKGFMTEQLIHYIMRISKTKNKRVFIDTKKIDFEPYRGAYFITPNLNELSKVCKTSIQDIKKELIFYSELVLKKYGIENILVTQGSHGITYVTKGAHQQHRGIYVKAKNTIGAGDTVIAILAMCLLKGFEMSLSVRLSNLAASIVISSMYDSTISIKTLLSKVQSS
ncbi:bifunctional heptose 7-phosphate kinase/heptose 1-phosphate adenyltransferase [Flagellimonas sp.]|uniref:bifunctional heptose 7-phosphate kinase/heptose 1-phosphate adenyltransferase n=1 Tax=Flagellimonas sp. TaxID=2058762 RepID=UPI003B59DE02